MLDKTFDKILDWLERNWHKKFAAVVSPAFAFLLSLYFFYSKETQNIPLLGWIGATGIALVVELVWIFTNRLPRVTKGNAGIVIGILCDEPEEDKQVRVDFIANLRSLIHQGGSRFELIELPSWSLTSLEDHVAMNKILNTVGGHFLLYGRVKLRNKDGKPAHLLQFEGIVRHRPVAENIRQVLQDDFTNVLPRKVTIERENDAFTFEATSEWADVSTRFIVGTAALISGDVAYSESLLLYVQNKLETNNSSFGGVKEIKRRLNVRFRDLYRAWVYYLYQAYFSTHDKTFIIKTDDISSKLLRFEPNNRYALIAKAISEFVLRRNVSGAHKLVTASKNDDDCVWRFSRAFLHAYQGKMDEAVADYNLCFKGVFNVTTPIECEEFIQSILAEEPNCIQLHFCLGYINYNAKQDFVAAKRDLSKFIEVNTGNKFPKQLAIAKTLLNEIASKETVTK